MFLNWKFLELYVLSFFDLIIRQLHVNNFYTTVGAPTTSPIVTCEATRETVAEANPLLIAVSDNSVATADSSAKSLNFHYLLFLFDIHLMSHRRLQIIKGEYFQITP